jgi:aromatic-L-amino-acid decarboxylase
MQPYQADDFRTRAARAADYIARYWERVEHLPVLSRVAPGDVLAKLPVHPPERGEPLGPNLAADLDAVVLPGLTHWQSPNFFAYFPSNISEPAVIAELLSAGLGVQGMLWATSPACTELEMRMLDWVGESIGLPAAFLFGERPGAAAGGGVIQGTASEATLSALVAGRHRALRALPPERRRAALPRLTAYTSTQAHSSVVKAAMVAGLALDAGDREQVRLIETDDAYAMRPDALGAALRDDLAAGRLPCFVAASVGTTGSTAVDPLERIAGAIESACPPGAPRPWLHVDAAHSGAACVCPEFRWMLGGVARADSVAFNPHKWLLTNFDCNCFWTRDRASLTASMSITPEYLRNPASDASAVVDYRDWHTPLGRRFRALKLWLVYRHYGVEGLRAHVRGHVRLAALFEDWVRSDARFEVCTPRTVNLVCFRLRPLAGETPAACDTRNKALLDRLNATGRVYLSHTVLPAVGATPPRLVLRMAIGAVRTREEHVRGAWTLMQELAAGGVPGP